MADGAPWIITLMLGCAGWYVTHTVERVTSSPTLEYSLTVTAGTSASNRVAKLELINLTRDRVFNDVSIDFLGEDGVRLERGHTETVQPADDGSTSPTADGGTSSFNIARMQPGNVYRLIVPFRGNPPPTVRITSDKSIIRAIPPSLETSFARNEFAYLIAIGIGLVTLLGLTKFAQFALANRQDAAAVLASSAPPGPPGQPAPAVPAALDEVEARFQTTIQSCDEASPS